MRNESKLLLVCAQTLLCGGLASCNPNIKASETSFDSSTEQTISASDASSSEAVSSASSLTEESSSEEQQADLYAELTNQVYADDSENISASGAVKINCDFSKPSDPALIKKIDMYNAGCVNPVERYERDMAYCKLLNSNSLRIDASIGKDNGNAGQYLVTDEYDIYDEDDEADTYKIDKGSLNYDFSELDKTLGYFQEMNTLPYVSWSYIPAPLQYNGKFLKLETRITNWQEVFEEIYYQYAKYYLDKGLRIGYNEIYNEPDLEILKYFGVFEDDTEGFLDIDSFAPLEDDLVTRNPAKGCYPDFYEYGVKGILRANPDATVGGPAFALGEIGVQDWVGFFPRVKERKIPIDFYSFHSYLDGETWFLPESKRKKGRKNELESVVDGLESDAHFLKTAVHINEYSCLNGDNGLNAGDNADFNYYYGAKQTLDGIVEVANRSSVQLVNWAQVMSCTTTKNDPYGLIDREGNPKAAYNAMLAYQDMPVWRYTVNVSETDSGLKTLVSTDHDKISILLWNENSSRGEDGLPSAKGDRTAAIKLSSPKFKGGKRTVYRIDKDHASYGDKTATKLLSPQNRMELSGDEDYVWTGNVPAEGVVYITINKDEVNDFAIDNSNQHFANTIKTQYWYEDRYRGLTGSSEEYGDYVNGLSGSYAHFDDHSWKTYLGVGSCAGKSDGSCAGQAVASCAVTCDDMPTDFRIIVDKDVRAKQLNEYSNLSVRIDFYDDANKTYATSVTLHNGIYDISAEPNEQDNKLSSLSPYPWGTERLADKEVQYEGNVWDVDLSSLAPSSWLNGSRRAMVSYTMRNTGANSRCVITLEK